MEEALAAHGLSVRGGFNFDAGEVAPTGPSGKPARSVMLVGSNGAAFWPHFQTWRRAQARDVPEPLDTWSRQVTSAVASAVGARAVSPNDRPFLPFQTWAMRAEGLKPSPLGILMHPEFGLWHSYRGALLFDVEIESPQLRSQIHLCDLCPEKPCIKSCPVDAYSERGFEHEACLGHVRSAEGWKCRLSGCQDRNACPYGTGYRYPADMQEFLMAAFSRPAI